MLNVITKEGIRKRVTEVNREELLKLVEPGYVLERQMVDGDIGLMNRQPTLHKLSIMAHTIKVIPGKTHEDTRLGLHPLQRRLRR